MATATQRPKGKKIGASQPPAKAPVKRFCSNPKSTPPVLPAGISNERARLIVFNKLKWVNGTTLHYYFFNKPSDGDELEYEDGSKEWKPWKGTKGQMDVVRKAFKMWKALGIGLKFKEVKDREEAELRIGFMEDDGSWSYIGRDALKQPVNARTMNFGWNIDTSDRHNGIDTALHEIGHALGFPHEHQNPFAGIEWNKEAVYRSLGAPPNNWDRDTTYENIIKKLGRNEVNGSAWDPDSIMHYPFEKGLIKKPDKYVSGLEPAGGLSEQDKKFALFFYPPLTANKEIKVSEMVSYDIDVKNSQQRNYVFAPSQTKKYTIQTFGKLDTVMVLNERLENGQEQYLSGDDNSGTDKNSMLETKLFRGKTYVIKLRVYYKNPNEKAALMIS